MAYDQCFDYFYRKWVVACGMVRIGLCRLGLLHGLANVFNSEASVV